MTLKTRVQKIGGFLSGMVIPNLGAFIAWGLLTAVGIAIGSETLSAFISPMLMYLLPILIAFAGGKMVYDYRGGVIATIATIGVIIGSDITMFLGAMIMGPLSALLIKKFDEAADGKIPVGFELLVNNFSVGILGSILAVIGKVFVAPAIGSLTVVLSAGANVLVENNLLPLTAIIIEPAKILFLNNAIGQGVLTPIATSQLAEYGKSLFYLLESNPGPGMGVLLAYCLFAKGQSKASAMGATVIHFFGGIHEIYFPFILMQPILVVPLIISGAIGTFIFTLFNVGLVGVASPGSIISITVMAASGDRLAIYLAILASTVVSFLLSIPFIKNASNEDEDLQKAAKEMEAMKGKKSRVSSVFEAKAVAVDYSTVKSIIYACDAGLGSSAMGASVVSKKLKAAGITDIKVKHASIANLPIACDLIITHSSLADRVNSIQGDTPCIVVNDYMNAPEYVTLINDVLEARGQKA